MGLQVPNFSLIVSDIGKLILSNTKLNTHEKFELSDIKHQS